MSNRLYIQLISLEKSYKSKQVSTKSSILNNGRIKKYDGQDAGANSMFLKAENLPIGQPEKKHFISRYKQRMTGSLTISQAQS